MDPVDSPDKSCGPFYKLRHAPPAIAAAADALRFADAIESQILSRDSETEVIACLSACMASTETARWYTSYVSSHKQFTLYEFCEALMADFGVPQDVRLSRDDLKTTGLITLELDKNIGVFRAVSLRSTELETELKKAKEALAAAEDEIIALRGRLARAEAELAHAKDDSKELAATRDLIDLREVLDSCLVRSKALVSVLPAETKPMSRPATATGIPRKALDATVKPITPFRKPAAAGAGLRPPIPSGFRKVRSSTDLHESARKPGRKDEHAKYLVLKIVNIIFHYDTACAIGATSHEPCVTSWEGFRGFYVALPNDSSWKELRAEFIKTLGRFDPDNLERYRTISKVAFFDDLKGPEVAESVWPHVKDKIKYLEVEISLHSRGSSKSQSRK